jgi:hypothetical protein
MMKLEKTKEDKAAESKRNELLKFLNASYDWCVGIADAEGAECPFDCLRAGAFGDSAFGDTYKHFVSCL